jgi:hypothetical protein
MTMAPKRPYTHPSASPNQPPAKSIVAGHKVVQSGEPTSGVAKLGYKGPGGKKPK